jgi:hypothetical protein
LAITVHFSDRGSKSAPLFNMFVEHGQVVENETLWPPQINRSDPVHIAACCVRAERGPAGALVHVP